MLSAKQPRSGEEGKLGVGTIDAAAAAAVVDPPNPNAALNQFVETDATTGAPVFSSASWANASWFSS